MKKSTKQSLVFAGCIIAIATTIYVLYNFFINEGDQVIVEVDGQIENSYSLLHNQEIEILTNDGKDKNILIIEDETAYVKSANCSNQVCVHTRPISKQGESIICLPHKVIIYIENNQERELDGFAN